MPPSEPVTWEQAREYIEDGSLEAISNLGRSQEGLDKYWRFKQEVLPQYASMAEYVKISVFSPPVELDEHGKKRVAGPLQPGPEPVIVFRPNDFPYWFTEGIEHHVLWSTQPLPAEVALQHIEAQRQGYEYLWWVNPPVLQTIPELWHAHVVSRPKPAA